VTQTPVAIPSELPSQLAYMTSLRKLVAYNVKGEVSLMLPLSLQHLDLMGTTLTRALPAGLAAFQQLEFLAVKNVPDVPVVNEYVNSIPSQLALLTRLTALELNGAFKGSIPDSIYTLPHLKRLVFTKHQLTGSISPHLSKLADLTELHIFGLYGPMPNPRSSAR
jgi:hypothetical protein